MVEQIIGLKVGLVEYVKSLKCGFSFLYVQFNTTFFLLYICNSQINNRWCHKQYVKSSVNKYKMLCYFRLNSPSKMKIKKIKRICVNLWSKKFKLKKIIAIQFKHLCISIFIVFLFFSIYADYRQREGGGNRREREKYFVENWGIAA